MPEFLKKHIDYDPELERSVLGIFLLEPDAFGACYGLLESECFYDDNNKTVFAELESMWRDGYQLDLVSIARRFYDKGIVQFGDRNTAYYLCWLSLDVVSSAHIRQWCLMLRELYAKRIMHMATNGGLHGDDIFQQAGNIQKMINKALEIRNTDDWMSGNMVAQQLIEAMERAKETGISGVTTGITALDDMNGSFKEGQMIVIGARPSVGKSAFFGRIATKVAASGKKVGVISLEMAAKDVFARLVAAETEIPYQDIDKNQIAEESQRNYVYQGINRVASLPIYFSETAQVNIHDIRAKADKLQRRHGIDILIIDYLQLIESSGNKNKNRENEVSEISRGIKVMAMNMKIPVIALAQLNRNVENRKGADRYPQLSDLRESGSLEQDADVVMFLHRDYMSGLLTDEGGNSTENQADLIVRKWRNGSTTHIKLHFTGETMKFMELSEVNFRDRTYPNQTMPEPEPKHYKIINQSFDKGDLPF